MKTLNTLTQEVFSQTGNSSNGTLVHNVRPIIKLSLDGILLYANTTGIDFLEMLSDQVKGPAIKYILEKCPGILDPHCNLDLCFQLYDMKFYFSVVAFKEAGYIGMYSYRQVHLNNPGTLVA